MQIVAYQRLRAHKNNLDRYARLLATKLTETERQYVHQRIAEEHIAITKIEAEYLENSGAVSALESERC